MKAYIENIRKFLFNNKLKQWYWFIGLWFLGLLTTFALTYPFKLLINLYLK